MSLTSRTIEIIDDAVVAVRAQYPRGCQTGPLLAVCLELYDGLSDADRRWLPTYPEFAAAVADKAMRAAAA